ncbi:MAG: hypothetical protein K2Y26_17965 [Gemmatimonadaceae bacterium]|nr:hypothetical protein [Gemmatimonadaceae bacterium]
MMADAMTPEAIRAAIAADEALQALVPDTAALAAALSVGRTRLTERLITERRILSALGVIAGAAFLDALDAFIKQPLAPEHPLAPYHSGITRAVGWLKTNEGIDIGDPASQAMVQALAAAGVVDAQSAATVMALAVVPDPVAEFDVRRALFADDGTLLL